MSKTGRRGDLGPGTGVSPLPRLLTLLILALPAALACRRPPPPVDAAKGTNPADQKGIEQLREEYLRLYNDQDIEGLGKLFTDDAVFIPEDDATCEGKKEIADCLDSLFEEDDSTLEFDVKETQVIQDWAFERIDATFVSTDSVTGEEVETWARYLWILRRQPGGEWRIARLIYNIDESGDEDDGQPPQQQT